MEKRLVCLVRYQAMGKTRAREHRLAVKKIVSMNQALYSLGAIVIDNLKDRGKLVSLAVHRIKDVRVSNP